ncbi:peptidase [Mangrovibacterium diazotrophicum]|uniref:Putative proteasome-type protease n=1 Tax=Mangrovibacterium diazotrophicum TaxID=1261403 RepID=A0A419VY69_9BACT|nr:peptidase [Mangrovibacterium diazotrophicum]RKD88175.1 putative proteasome-type protease [Mangrovibacterium diazotrophicum]
MTYCIGIKLKAGLVALSDSRITSGNETTNARKYKIYEQGDQHIFLMTSGLRSVRDKTLTYFQESLNDKLDNFNKLYEVVNALGDQIKRVAAEDKRSLAESGLDFSINTIVGGKLVGDDEHKLYMLYPQGNWIEIGEGTPFCIIGNSGYGTPILRRTITPYSSIRFALTAAFLSFDSTRVSANDVGYPVDVMIYEKESSKIKVKRFFEGDLQAISKMWGEMLTQSVNKIPEDWVDSILSE